MTPGAKADAPGFQVNKEQTKEGQRTGKICWVVKILPALCLTFVNSLSTQGPLSVFGPPVHNLRRTCPGGTWNPGASGFAPGVSPVQAASHSPLKQVAIDLGGGFRALMTETAALERYKKKHSVIKLTPRDELERKKAKPLMKVLEVLDVKQNAFKTDGVWVELTLAKQDRKEGGGIHVVGKIWEMKVSEASEVEQPSVTGKREGHPCCGLHLSDEGVGGVGGKRGYLLLHSYWIAFHRVGVWIKSTLVNQHREEGGAGGSSCCRLHSGCWMEVEQEGGLECWKGS
ncbi:hypothetical protein DFH08DRAFT_813045 [Mycena albidolilacea]|uniref:Uncharacterized protein n=1 Tax=Mycena albidolilacea TaxID=1033008 RepID=A0AAD7EMQ1_9AGAR|nr:hypothetical protein DFH08DRAFT_813045 [Mycena albidolilacea]